MLKEFVSKPVEIQGHQFDGTRESATKISNWVKSDPKSEYVGAELRMPSEVHILGSDRGHLEGRVHLMIYTGRTTLVAYPQEWVIKDLDTNNYSAMSHARLLSKYNKK